MERPMSQAAKYRYDKTISMRRQRELQLEETAIELNKRFSYWNSITIKQHDAWSSCNYFQTR